jgi:hypothetical protein
MIWNTLKTIAKVVFWVLIVTCILAIPLAYINDRQWSLEANIDCHTVSWLERETERDDELVQTIPEAVLGNPNALQHQKYSISIPNYTKSDQSAEHFTQLLRHLAHFCSGLLAGYFHLLDSEGYQKAAHRVSFAKDEPLTNTYRILKRNPTRVEARRVEDSERRSSWSRILILLRLKAQSWFSRPSNGYPRGPEKICPSMGLECRVFFRQRSRAQHSWSTVQNI